MTITAFTQRRSFRFFIRLYLPISRRYQMASGLLSSGIHRILNWLEWKAAWRYWSASLSCSSDGNACSWRRRVLVCQCDSSSLADSCLLLQSEWEFLSYKKPPMFSTHFGCVENHKRLWYTLTAPCGCWLGTHAMSPNLTMRAQFKSFHWWAIWHIQTGSFSFV